MEKSSAQKVTFDPELQDMIIPVENIIKQRIPSNQLFELKLEDQIIGPFSKETLRTYFENEVVQDQKIQIKTLDQERWINFFEHPFFQRRKPQLVSTSDNNEPATIEEELYILKNGQKSGPFSVEQVKEQLEDKEILMTDMISRNEGANWERIYSLTEFDRRHLASPSALPSAPEKQTFKNASLKIIHTPLEDDETEAILSLAYIGNVSSGKASMAETLRREEELSQKEEPQAAVESALPKATTSWKKILFFVGITVATLLAAVIYFTGSNSTSDLKEKIRKETPVKPRKATVKKRKPKFVAKKAKLIRPKSKPKLVAPQKATSSPKKKIRGLKKRKAKTPFKKSRTYQKKTFDHSIGSQVDDSANFVEGGIDNPIELEPAEEFDDNYGIDVKQAEDFENEGPDSEKELFDEEVSY